MTRGLIAAGSSPVPIYVKSVEDRCPPDVVCNINTNLTHQTSCPVLHFYDGGKIKDLLRLVEALCLEPRPRHRQRSSHNKTALSLLPVGMTATNGSDVVQYGRPIFDDFFQHLWPYISNNAANVVFQMVKRLWLIRIDQ
ncbi:hypothetical protein TNCV_904111 [Trichonephila clavipes]|nr:hypothetical protein TNCV_904111 [Trichonephila clavipes]